MNQRINGMSMEQRIAHLKTRTIQSSDIDGTITCDITVSENGTGDDPVTQRASYAKTPAPAGSISTPTVLTPPDGAGIGGDITYYPVTSEVFSVDDPSVFCGSSRPLSDNSLFSGTVWVGDKYLTYGSAAPYTILSSTDGKTWTTVSTSAFGSSGSAANNMFYHSVNNVVYAFTANNIYFSSNKGVSFTDLRKSTILKAAQNRVTEEIRIFGVNGSIWLADPDTSAGVELVHTTTQWQSAGEIAYADHVVDDTYLVASRGAAPSYEYALHRTTDGGANWSTPTGIPAGLNIRAMGADSAGNALVFAYNNAGTIMDVYKSTDNGASFSAATLPLEGDFVNQFYYTDGWFYAVYERNIFRTKNLGESWEDCGRTVGNSKGMYAHNGFFIVENAGGTGDLIGWSSNGVTFTASGLILELTDSTVYSSINSQPVSLTLEEAFQADQGVRVFGANGTNSKLTSIEGTTMYLASNIGVNVGDQIEGLEEFTEFGPDADDLAFTSSIPSGTDITTYGNATWEVDTDANFSSPMTATKVIAPGSTQELLPSERGAIDLDPDITYYVRVEYDSTDPSGIQSGYSDANQFKTTAPQDGWNPATASEASGWQSVTYGADKFVAVAYSGTNKVMYSTDGISWSTAAATEANAWYSVTYGADKFVAVAYSGTNRITYSTDGINWTPVAAPEASGWFSVTYGDGKFVAVAASGTNRVMYSTDGISWTLAAATEASTWYSVTYGDGKFVAVSYDGTNRVMYSTDGINWNPATASEASGWQSVTYGDGKFVAIASKGTNRVMYSTDGINWTSAAAAEANQWQSVTYGDGKFVAVAFDGTNQVMYSTDAINWSPAAATEANGWQSVTYGDNKFVAVSGDGTYQVMWSETGVGDPATFTAYDADNNKSVNDLDIVARYGVDPTADNTHLGIYELTEQPTGTVAAYVPDGDKYKPVIDLSQPLEQAQAEAAQANARLDEANATIETMRSNFETRIAALESES